MKKLAICIPNYNKPECFFRLLKQSIRQIKVYMCIEEVEICIRDDASDWDITSEVNKIMVENDEISIKYQRSNTNAGRWHNIKECVAMSDAEYCWIIGNDDIYAQEDAIDVIVNKLTYSTNEFDILTFPEILFDGEMYTKVKQIPAGEGERFFDLTKESDFEEWFRKPLTALNFFSDPMLVIFKKELWDQYVDRINLYPDGFGFWAVLGTIALSGGIIKYIDQYFIVRSSKEDSLYRLNIMFTYLYMRDALVYWRQLLNINQKAAKIFDTSVLGTVVVLYYDEIMKSNEITDAQKQDIKDVELSEVIKLYRKMQLTAEKYSQLTGKKILLFGSGKNAEKVRDKLHSQGYTIQCYVENNRKKQGKSIRGIEIISVEQSLEIFNSVYIISAYGNGAIYDIYMQLKERNVAEDNIFIRVEKIYENV